MGHATAAARDETGPGAGADAEGPLEILRWAVERYAPRLAFATGFGPEGLVLLDLIGRHLLEVDVFTIDTGLLFPETYRLWRQLEERYQRKIRAVRPAFDLQQQAARHGEALWQREPDRCCGIRKVDPLAEALRGHQAWISAIRADQTKERALARVVEEDRRFGLVKVNPLLAWSSDDVWSYLRDHDVPTNPLHQVGYPSIGCWPCTSPARPGEDPRAGRWRGRIKTECGLHLRHPGTPGSPVESKDEARAS
ncbi:MAG TPA: phosphoadenylyl-sulfate reductase [Vicinamibacteria bacterium]|nr:phosphoadenylyl-sulfate reductase [Vicinamibacteria bacterium]